MNKNFPHDAVTALRQAALLEGAAWAQHEQRRREGQSWAPWEHMEEKWKARARAELKPQVPFGSLLPTLSERTLGASATSAACLQCGVRQHPANMCPIGESVDAEGGCEYLCQECRGGL